MPKHGDRSRLPEISSVLVNNESTLARVRKLAQDRYGEAARVQIRLEPGEIQAVVSLSKTGPALVGGPVIQFQQDDLDDAAAMGQFPPDLWEAALQELAQVLTKSEAAS